MQKMMTKELEGRVPKLYAQDGAGMDAVAYVHYFSCRNGWDWYMTEYDPESRDAFGFVCGADAEFGYFSIAEFEELNKARGFEYVEREYGFEPTRLSDIGRVAGRMNRNPEAGEEL